MKDWLRLRPYLHISPRLGGKNLKATKCYISSYVKKKENIAAHRFSPLLHYKIVDHRYKRDKNNIIEGGKVGRSYKAKIRPIYYPNHLDAQIFAYYSHLIEKKLKPIYESNVDLNNSVIGYRAIRFDEHRNKCTIDFAKEVFDFISTNEACELSVVCLDITSFFDNLDHKKLKQSWGELFDQKILDIDHYQVFRAVTNASYVDLEELIPLIPDFDKQKVSLLKNSKYNSLFKTFPQFRSIIYQHKLLRRYDSKKLKIGIPQGTPISATLSNLYFLNADIEIAKMASTVKGLYRRYSDDILLVLPTEHIDLAICKIKEIIENDLWLELQDKKTIFAHLSRENIDLPWNIKVCDWQNCVMDKPISYLGFDFDGKNIRIRNSSISKYYRSLKRAIRRRAFYARVQVAKNKSAEIKKDAWLFRAGIFRGKTHLGAARKKVNGKIFWGNYISYAHTAARIMGNEASVGINKQMKNHWKVVTSEIKKFETAYDLPKAPKTTRYIK
jgi:hypothetical protein